jgi:hypothetical protein
MLKLIVVGTDADDEQDLRAAHAAHHRAEGVEVRVLGGGHHQTVVEHLDDALFERPLADVLVVIGTEASSVDEVEFLCSVLPDRWDLAAVTTGADLGPSVEDVVRFGGAFRVGPLCQAGGFVGDGLLSLHDRLAAVGFRSAVRAYPELGTASARPA